MKLEVRNGSFSYRAGQPLLEGVCFDAGPGDVLAILGPNGAGKTTLLRCMLNLSRWKNGQTLLDGEDVRSMPERALWQKVAYVPQAKQSSLFCTVEEMVLLGRSSRIGPFSAPGKKDMEKVHAAIERLGLSHLTGRRCCELSGGEHQMVLIARALASEPGVLVLDEPESNLDFKNQLLVLDTIEDLAKAGLTVIFNTHFPAHALRRASKALMLGRGGKSVYGKAADVVTEACISEFFGVHAVIGGIQTPAGVYQDVIPVSMGHGA